MKTRQVMVINRLLDLNLEVKSRLLDEDLDQIDSMLEVEDAKIDMKLSRLLKTLATPDCWNNPSIRTQTIKAINKAYRHDTRLDMLRTACGEERDRRMHSTEEPLQEQVTVIEVEYRAACNSAKPVIRNTAA